MSVVFSNPLLSKPAEVCLVHMPYASLERPSIALSILQAALRQRGIGSSILYANILFGEKIGAHIYDVINKSQSHTLAGEWTFSKACFPDFESSDEGYFDHTRFGLDCLQPFIAGLGSHLSITEVLQRIRTMTPGFIEEMAQAILRLKPRIVGCSSTFQQHCASLAVLKKIKALAPEVVTVMGGANCEASMGIVTHRECPWIDYVISGEADIAFPELVSLILDGGTIRLADLPAGVISPLHRDEVHYALLEQLPPRAKLKNMDDSPAPDYDDYFTFLRHSSVGRYIKPGLLMETSRGCWWGAISHCTFCGLNGESMAHRAKDQERVLREINAITAKYKQYSVEVVDNILEMDYFKFLIPQLALQQPKYDIFYETKANLNRDKLRKLSAAGIRWLQPGIESLDNTILKMIGKGTSSKVNLQLMKWALQEGIFVLWILLYDLPGEDDAIYLKMAEWLPCISHLQPPSGLSFIQINRFSPYQMHPEKYGITLSADKAYSFVYPWPGKSINDFAYYFDDYSRERVKIDYYRTGPTARPGLDAVKEVMNQWQIDWSVKPVNETKIEDQRCSLVYEEKEGSLVVYDTRSCAVQRKHVLEGVSKALFFACDSFQTLNGIATQLRDSGQDWTPEEIRGGLEELCRNKIILHLDEAYFTLALPFPSAPLPKRTNYPGGRIYSKVEVKSLELLEMAEHALTSF